MKDLSVNPRVKIPNRKVLSTTGSEFCIVSRDAGMKRKQRLLKVYIEFRNTIYCWGINFVDRWCNIEILLMTRNINPAGIPDYIKDRRFAWEHGRASRLHRNE